MSSVDDATGVIAQNGTSIPLPATAQPSDLTAWLNSPGGPPPAGVTAAIGHATRSIATPVSLSAVTIGLMLVFLGLRAYSKLGLIRQLNWDDATCLIGALGAITTYVAFVYTMTVGTMGYHQWDLTIGQLTVDANFVGSCAFYVGCAVASIFTKITCFLMYWTMFRQLQPMRWVLIVGGTLCTLPLVILSILQLYYYIPSPSQTWLQHQMTWGHTQRSFDMLLPISIVSLVCDIFILVIPIRPIWRTTMTRRRRLYVILLFSAGLTACIASALNVGYRYDGLHNESTDTTGRYSGIYTVSVVEFAVGLTCASAPHAFQALQRLMLYHYSDGQVLQRRPSLFTGLGPTRRCQEDDHGSPGVPTVTVLPKAEEA